MKFSDLTVKIFADGADKASMLDMYAKPFIKGLTTNPTLMKKAGITDYEAFAREILATIKDKSISFEVFSDDFEDMARQAMKIAAWGDNVYVKIPVTNTKGQSAAPLIQELAQAKVQLNVTAITTLEQVTAVSAALKNHAPSYISVFAGRIADTGVDPLPLMQESLAMMAEYPQQEMIWASPRELLNIVQAHDIGCHIITVTSDIIKKLNLLDKDLTAYSLETVKMFYDDAVAAGFKL
jgi:transaldolase